MPQFVRLRGKRGHQRRMAMPQCVHGNAAGQIDVFPTLGAPHTAAQRVVGHHIGKGEIGGEAVLHGVAFVGEWQE